MPENPRGPIETGSSGVGQLYDRNAEIVDGAAAGNVHFGYWHDETDRSSLQEATDRLTDLVADRLAIAPGQRLLDVGCGTGRPALRVAARGAHVTGVAISHQEIARAPARVAGGGGAGRGPRFPAGRAGRGGLLGGGRGRRHEKLPPGGGNGCGCPRSQRGPPPSGHCGTRCLGRMGRTRTGAVRTPGAPRP
ncbi:SAM-dependent methyltransferase [Streptomyces sp. NPDC058953]|uniref:SAM-dependent methyltransferase n=1 Tax=Streptomyces sp. NPDC058953 TaxID=3346676 RepID=UPI00368C3677